MLVIQDVELEFDTLDVNTIAAYEKALARFNQGLADIDNDDHESLADTMRKQCRLVFQFFNDLFGEGTDKEIFGSKENLGLCIDAFEQVVLEMQRQGDAHKSKLAKYAPNRLAHRRIGQ